MKRKSQRMGRGLPKKPLKELEKFQKTHDDDLKLIENLRKDHDKSSKTAEDL
jgi:hypothetical protein